MGFENSAGLNVNNHYGVRDTGGAVGQETRDGSAVTLRVDLTGPSLADGFVPPVVVPKGVKFKSAYLRVDEAFTITGTAPEVDVGELGAESTNGVNITEANLGTVTTLDLTSALAGKWATTSATTADKKVGIALTDAVFGADGKATLVLEYLQIAK